MRAPVLLICPIHPTSWKHDSEKVRLDGRGVHDFHCYCGEACCSCCSSSASCSSSITSPKVSSISNEKRTMPLSLPLSRSTGLDRRGRREPRRRLPRCNRDPEPT